MGIRTAVYASSVQRNIGLRMNEVAPVQAMHKRWLGGNAPAAHVEMATWYFESLSSPPPALVDAQGKKVGDAFSASLPAERFPFGKVRYQQTDVGLDHSFDVTQTFTRTR